MARMLEDRFLHRVYPVSWMTAGVCTELDDSWCPVHPQEVRILRLGVRART